MCKTCTNVTTSLRSSKSWRINHSINNPIKSFFYLIFIFNAINHITPDRIYNLNNESDEDYSKFKGFFANFEYNQIKRRLKRGKKIGAKFGHWTNGIPPFPYVYDAPKKGLVINEENRRIYVEMKKMFFEGITFKKIAWYLNGKEIPSPRGSVWHENAVRRIMIDETHLGRIISGKQKGSGHITKNGMVLTEKQRKKNVLVLLPRSEWTIIENCHEALKTQEEHDEILNLLKKRKLIPDVATKGKYILSGLVFCAKCKKAIMLHTRNHRRPITKGCQYHDPYGNKCFNKAISSELLEDALARKLSEYEKDLLEVSSSNLDRELRINNVITEKNSNVEKMKQSIERIREMYEDGEYTKDVYQNRLNSRKELLSILENEINELKRELNLISQTSNEQRLNRIKYFREILNGKTDIKLINAELRKIVSRIEYKRETKEKIEIDISFY